MTDREQELLEALQQAAATIATFSTHVEIESMRQFALDQFHLARAAIAKAET